MKKIYALLPAYNESENIESLIDSWYKQRDNLKNNFNYDLIIMPVDDKSTDSTKEIIMKMEKKYSNVKPIYHLKNQNLGGVLRTGFKKFLDIGKDGDLICVMDGDNTHDPKYINDMLKNLFDNKLDCVIASRYCDNSEIVGVPKHRNFLSSGAKFYYKLMLKIPNVQDYTCGYRVYSYNIIAKAFKDYGDKFIEESGFSCMMEIIYKLHLSGAKIGETGFVLRYDNKLGESKMKVLKTVKNSLITALKLRNKKRKILKENNLTN